MSSHRPANPRPEIVVHCEGAFRDQALQLALRYRPARPIEIALEITHGTRTVSWSVSREMAAAGLDGRVGDDGGDIVIEPSDTEPDIVWFTLRNGADGGWARLLLPARSLRQVLDRSYVLVPPGTEQVWSDYDDLALEAFLTAAAPPEPPAGTGS